MDINTNKLDIYKYFASPDVASYCRNKGKIFTPLEMAVIINDSSCPINGNCYPELVEPSPGIHGTTFRTAWS